MSLGIKKFCPYSDVGCKHCHDYEVDGVDENGCHIMWYEYECSATCDGCAKESEVKNG